MKDKKLKKKNYLLLHIRSIDNVSEELIEKFKSGAIEVLKTKDPVKALAAALAVISGCTKVTQRSLLSSKEVNFVFCHFS